MIIYVISAHPGALAGMLGAVRRRHGHDIALRFANQLPRHLSPREPVVTIVDLAHPPAGLVSPPAVSAPGDPYILLTRPSQDLAMPWVNFLLSSGAKLFTLRGDEAELPGLVSLLEGFIDGIDPSHVVTAVLRSVPRLAAAADFVALILEHPWDIRRPRDLCKYACCGESLVRRRCDEIGLTRCEHLITLVRAVAFGHLTADCGITAGQARLWVGISDPSNFRRQARRAAYAGRTPP